mmetsp:Transcript_3769/g.8791  ORF Transcript_3769/g.8791 Transcript_3769/m.8791 type:complete len:101 (-) Transcript_3769:782-1084(-)
MKTSTTVFSECVSRRFGAAAEAMEVGTEGVPSAEEGREEGGVEAAAAASTAGVDEVVAAPPSAAGAAATVEAVVTMVSVRLPLRDVGGERAKPMPTTSPT